jgi:hypothetical protein
MSSQQRPVLTQPQFSPSVIRTKPLHFPPESRRMIHLPQMREFMENQVIPHEHRRLDQSPVQRNRSLSRTRSPTRALVSHTDSPHRQPVSRGELPHHRRKFLAGECPEMPFNFAPQIRPRTFKHLTAETDRARFSVRSRFDVYRIAAEKNPGSNPPSLGMLWAFLDFLELPFDPVAISHRKAPGFRVGTTARDGHSCGAVCPQPKHIPARDTPPRPPPGSAPATAEPAVFRRSTTPRVIRPVSASKRIQTARSD